MSEPRARLRCAHVHPPRDVAFARVTGHPENLVPAARVLNVTATAEHNRNVPILSGRHLGLFFDLSELALDLLLFDGLATRAQKI